MTGETREMTPEEIADQIVSRKRPRKWLAADLATIIERAEKRGRRAALPVPALSPNECPDCIANGVLCSVHLRAALPVPAPDPDVCPDCGITRKQMAAMCKRHLMFPAPALDALRLAASQLVRLGNQPGLDDDEWEAAFTALEDALRGETP